MSLFLLAAAGCLRTSLNLQKDFDLTPETPSFTFTVDPIKRDQVIKISASADQPISVVVGLAKHADELPKEWTSGKYTEKTLEKAPKTTTVDISATIPANEKATVFVAADTSKKTHVKLKITN